MLQRPQEQNTNPSHVNALDTTWRPASNTHAIHGAATCDLTCTAQLGRASGNQARAPPTPQHNLKHLPLLSDISTPA